MLEIKKEDLTIMVYPENNREYLDFCDGLFDINFSDTIAIINNGTTQYEFEAWENHMICYIADRIEGSDPAEYESFDELDVTHIIQNSPTLEDFISNIVDFVLTDMEDNNG